MSDRELLEAAARAAGVDVIFGPLGMAFHASGPLRTRRWDPIGDDGDALRLAVKLGLYIQGKFTAHQSVDEFVQLGELAAVRRAIVRAAAAIGTQGDKG